MSGKYTRPNIRQRFTMSEKDVERCKKVFVAIPSWNARNREAADVWCAFNPWSREPGGVPVMVQNPARSYLDAATCERAKITARVVRITDEDVIELLAYRDRYMDYDPEADGARPNVK
jgi:hypothetical protein